MVMRNIGFSFKRFNKKHSIFLVISTSVIFSFWMITKNKTRQVSSLPQADSFSVPVTPTYPVLLDSLLVRLKTSNGIRISKMEMIFHVDSFESIGEIRRSMKQIHNHLIFILSDKDELVFKTPDKQSELQKEIAKQLNIFLFTGQIKNIDIKQTIVN